MRRFFYSILAVFGGIVSIIWFLRRRIFGFLLGLPPAKNGVTVTRNIPITMRDGVQLMTDHYAPRADGDHPTILIRSPYGRGYDSLPGGIGVIMFSERIAERGYHVIAQTTRGNYDSEGDFIPYVHEKDDGLDTIDWIREQEWYNGKLGMFGMSYLGLVQWAVAADVPDLQAIVPIITSSDLRNLQFPDGAFAFDISLRWAISVAGTARGTVDDPPWRLQAIQNTAQVDSIVQPAFMTLPLKDADETAIGQHVSFYQKWLETEGDPTHEFWQAADFRDNVGKTQARAHLIGGWYDIFLREFLEDYGRLVTANKAPYLTIGPWTHLDLEPLTGGLREGIAWFDAQLKGDTSQLRQNPVRIYVMGAEQWRNLPSYPPPSTPTRFYIHADGTVTRNVPEIASASTGYRFDPTDPTPALGGVLFSARAGRTDNAELEIRDDVLVFTSAPLTTSLDFIGQVEATLYVEVDCEHTDFFVRINDVAPDGQSTNICDGLYRITPDKGEAQPDGTLKITVDMWSTAYQLKAGHQLRVLIAGGAHPRWARNPGTGEPMASATSTRIQTQIIHHDAAHPSCVTLPVV